jgi:hypothetical protein
VFDTEWDSESPTKTKIPLNPSCVNDLLLIASYVQASLQSPCNLILQGKSSRLCKTVLCTRASQRNQYRVEYVICLLMCVDRIGRRICSIWIQLYRSVRVHSQPEHRTLLENLPSHLRFISRSQRSPHCLTSSMTLR